MSCFRWSNDIETLTLGPINAWLVSQSDSLQARVSEILSHQRQFIAVADQARDVILTHISAFRVEQAGLLVGRVYERLHHDQGIATKSHVIHITDAIMAKDDDATPVSVKISPATWSLAKPYLDEGKIVVGWYHSHPNIGAFFSGTDRNTQAAIFNHAYSLGWVIDWVRKEDAWFIGAESSPVDQVAVFVLPDNTAKQPNAAREETKNPASL
jgi:proteasome lid subunit RPN8/RPN11